MKRMCPNRQLAKILVVLLTSVAIMANGQSQSELDGGSTALKDGDYKVAEAIYRKALTESAESPEMLSNLGIALQMQGKSSEAIHVFERALKLKQMPRIYALLADERCKTRDLDGARPMLAKITHDYFQDP